MITGLTIRSAKRIFSIRQKGLYHLNEHTVFTPAGEKAVHLHRLNEQTLFTPAGKNGLVRSTLLIPPSVWLSKQDTCFSSRLFLKETRPSKKAGVLLFYKNRLRIAVFFLNITGPAAQHCIKVSSLFSYRILHKSLRCRALLLYRPSWTG